MIIVGDAIVSEDVIERKFICQLDKCKGECCIQGDAGAPLLHDELELIEGLIDKVRPYMSKKGLTLLEETGFYTRDSEKDLVTTCGNDGACVFVNIESDGTAKCSIEKAFEDGKIDFKKPISCHLYPIRAKRYGKYTALNYQDWDICGAACQAGNMMNIPVYQFLKEPLIRKMGPEWYSEFERVAEDWDDHKSV
ncbi:MAG: DUF3109 family protein [Bacteroidia bacterium]